MGLAESASRSRTREPSYRKTKHGVHSSVAQTDQNDMLRQPRLGLALLLLSFVRLPLALPLCAGDIMHLKRAWRQLTAFRNEIKQDAYQTELQTGGGAQQDPAQPCMHSSCQTIAIASVSTPQAIVAGNKVFQASLHTAQLAAVAHAPQEAVHQGTHTRRL